MFDPCVPKCQKEAEESIFLCNVNGQPLGISSPSLIFSWVGHTKMLGIILSFNSSISFTNCLQTETELNSLDLLFCTLDFCSFEKSGSRNLVREIWFEKSGLRNLVREIWFEKSGSANSDFFSGSRKVVDQKKKSEFAEPLF